MPSSLTSFLIAVVLALATRAIAATEPVTVDSPDGKTTIAVWLDDDGAPHYEIEREGKPIVAASRLGLVLQGDLDLSTGFESIVTSRDTVNETWVQPWGECREVTDAHHELGVTLSRLDVSRVYMLRIVFRVFDDGIGIRYELPMQTPVREVVIVDEKTEFDIARPATAWWIPAYEGLRFEYLYQSSPIEELATVHTPLTCEFEDGGCISIHEAALIDYTSMTLRHTEDRRLVADLVPWSDGIKVRTAAPMVSPWRTIQIADSPTELLASTMILNLNEPCKLDDTSWIKPGKYVGVWWEMHVGQSTWGSGDKHGATTANVKRYIDFAKQYGFDGVLVEGWNEGWDGDWMGNGHLFRFTKPYPDFDFDELSQYARDRNVFIIGHHETAGDIFNYERQLDEAMAYYQEHGVPAVKSGYVAYGQGIKRVADDGSYHNEWHHGQFMVQHHQRVVEAAARHHLAVFPHEPVKDTGLRRTYPNLMSREGARGQEYNAWSGDGRNPPDHTVILPFTRMLSGPMDFTPGIFDVLIESGDRPNDRISTTLAKQLALYVVLYSPFQMAADFPEVYEQHLDAFQFIRDVPTDWHETRPLAGKIGDYVVIARRDRDGNEWYLGAITDENARELRTPLSFLDPEKAYRAEIYRDADDADWETNPKAYTIETKQVTSDTTLTLRLAAGGGQAVRFVPE